MIRFIIIIFISHMQSLIAKMVLVRVGPKIKISIFNILKCNYPSLEILPTIFTRRTSSFVGQIRKQQNLKESNKIPDDEYEKGDFILYSHSPRKVLVKRNILPDGNKRINLHRLSYQDINTLGLNAKQDSVLLNVDSNSKCQFALEVTNPSEHVELAENSSKGKFVGIRSSLFILSKKDSALCSQGMSLLSWYKKNVYCPNCGKLLQNDGSRISKICHSESCSKSKRGNRHHPPINPVGICLVSNESHTKALLVRTPDHPPGMYTCISGFIEVGESIEDNIKREVAEEVGLEVQSIQYVSSQHWAFPASRLMIGCHATVKDSEEHVSIDENELEDAVWFTPTQIKESLDRVKEISSKGKGGLSLLSSENVSPSFQWVPPRGALANSLMKWWLKKFHTS